MRCCCCCYYYYPLLLLSQLLLLLHVLRPRTAVVVLPFCREDLRPVRSLRKSIFRLGLWLPAGARRAIRSRRIVAPVFNARFNHRANVNTTGSKQTWPSAADAKKDQGETGNAGLNLGWLNVQSLRNKTTAIHEIIEERNLDVAILTETWHGSGDDISLRLAAPSSYSAVDAVRKSDPNHGGIVVIHRSRYRCVRVPLPELASFEGLCVRLHVGGESVTLLSIYRPGSCRPSTLFFEELRTVLEMLVLQPGPIILGGDVNIHVEKEGDDDSVRFSELIESFNMIQHVVGPTHLHGGTLDLVATFSDTQLSRIVIDPAGMISDHSLVTAFMTVHHRVDPARTRQVRSWKKVDLSAFREAIRESALANPSPTSTSSELFEIYDGCLRRIADRFAPEHTACSKVRPLSPWFDADCRAIRRNCRRLERCYRRTKSVQDRAAWTAAVRQKHVDFLEKKNSYWSSRLSNESRTPSKVWKSMAKILRRDANQSTPPPSVLTADAFLKFFSEKVESVRSATGGHRPPEILLTAVSSLSNFRACTEDEARAIIMRSPSKSCSLDPIPTTILKECIDDLLPFLTAMCNASLLEGHLPVSQRHAIITPLIKKSNLDATDVKNYRPVSNLTFVSKVVERLVSERLVSFLQENNLMPVEQSAY